MTELSSSHQAVTIRSNALQDKTYQYQTGIHRRTRASILNATLELISEKGLTRTNMIEIADRAQVSRASLYNHFRDKNEVFVALIDQEITRICALALSAESRHTSLFVISRELSTHQALRSALEHDPDRTTEMLVARDHEIWVKIYRNLSEIFGTDAVGVGLIIRWLIGHVTAPLSEEHSRAQAERIIRALS